LAETGCGQSELIIYGFQQMMVSAQCIYKTTNDCTGQPDCMYLTDRYHKKFAVKNCCDYCYNIIYNSLPLSLLGLEKEIAKVAPKELRLHFTLETGLETKNVVQLYIDIMMKQKSQQEIPFQYTRGHFRRGVG